MNIVKKEYPKNLKVTVLFSFLIIILGIVMMQTIVLANSPLTLVINDQKVEQTPGPLLSNGRTLVPVRVISETLGAKVSWDPDARTVLVENNERSVLLTIDSHMVSYRGVDSQASAVDYDVIDVPPAIIESRTFVPLRLISNALGADINWEGQSRTVTVKSATNALRAFSDLQIASPWDQQTVVGKTVLHINSGSAAVSANPSAEIRYLLLDPGTKKGFVIARGKDSQASYTWIPETSQNGPKLLVAALYDGQNQVIAGDVVSITVQVQPSVSVVGLSENQVVTQVPLSLSSNLSFSPKYVRYDMVHLDSGKIITSNEADPFGPYLWRPMADSNGRYALTVVAVDHDGTSYPGKSVEFELALEKTLSLGGVKAGQNINGPVSLSAVRNFEVSQTQYWKRNVATDEHSLIAQTGFAAHSWFPGPDEQGAYELYVRVLDTRLRPQTSAPVAVNVTGTPQIRIRGAGPNQVITGDLSLSVVSNVTISDLRFELTDSSGGRKTIASGDAASAPFSWTPSESDSGKRTIRAVAQRPDGGQLISDTIPVSVYLGQLYRAQPIIEKAQFQNFASSLALESFSNTGMSAALQTAQAILETGWGQSLPVDKYNGTFSYNLFGIKGSGPAGSVISNTWEEYNGVAFRTDANFRAYQNVNQSWDDHKNLLLRASRYEPFRQVMHNSSQGAWALRRSGYATDSLYPIKLIDIIRTYDLKKLDEIDF